ncbi:MAG: phage integrase N-terminal SAM-like domain-containing protein, partial [Lactobacillus sp.]|nr:phage integrase N-terminal SAM-like domain-containing protein [Lactobacillus sp.]
MDQYPYQAAFHRELKARGRAPMTIDAYDATLRQLFNYLEDQRPGYAHDPSAKNVTETDVRAYLNWLRDEQDITLATFNKVLSQLSRYFRFLFTHQLIDTYPTLTIHGKATKPNQHLSTKWLLKLDDILADDQIQYFTRAVLFL